MGHDAKRRGSLIANQRKIRRNRPGSEQAQLDTPIPPACPESHSSRSSSSLEHSADETMSSVVCGERDTFTHTHRQRKMWLGLGQYSKSSTCTQPFHSRISLHTQTSLPVLRLPYITWSQSYFTVFIILHFMCFPPPQIIVFLHPPHTASDYLSLLSSCVVHNQWPHQALTDQHRPGFWFVLKDAEGGRDGVADLLATPGPVMDYLHPPVPTILIYPFTPPLPFFGSTHGGQRGEVVFQCWCAGQPAFIRMNQRGDKISPVTKQGYEIRVLIEFSSPGRGCGALNIIEFDRLMKRAPMLVLLLSTGPRESCPPLPYAHTHWRSTYMSTKYHSEKVDFSKLTVASESTRTPTRFAHLKWVVDLIVNR